MKPTAMDEDVKVFPYWTSKVRRFPLDSPFFASGNIERELLAKQVALDWTGDERHRHDMELDGEDGDGRELDCPVVGCRWTLGCLEEFEEHYRSRHSSCCSVCSGVYPTSRLLTIHVLESHDSFFRAKAARGYPVYECLVDACSSAKFKTRASRQQHLVDKHGFPPSFRFSARSRQKDRHHHDDRTGGALAAAMSRLNTGPPSIPSAVRFGRRPPFSLLPRPLLRQSVHRDQQTKKQGNPT